MAEIRVLLADDFEPWRLRVRSILESSPDFRVVGDASDGLEAVHKAQQMKPDLILLDVGLPKLNGIETQIQLHQLVPTANVLFLTQNSDADVAGAALRNGAQGYILKADTQSELLSGIKAILRGEKFVSSGMKPDVLGIS
jgi:DNA-binding NarL/FixJ family response regulator